MAPLAVVFGSNPQGQPARKFRMKVSEEALDVICREFTAFDSFQDLLYAEGGYFPSIDTRQPLLVLLADAYDLMQEYRGSPRRAYRYGGGE